MAATHVFTTARATRPDPVLLADGVKTATADSTAVLTFDPLSSAGWRGKKAAPWSSADIDAVQSLLDTVAADTPQKTAQREIDAMPIATKALLLTLLDEINRLRTQPLTIFTDVTPAQALAAVRTKAGQIS